jgi:hypothetical protein
VKPSSISFTAHGATRALLRIHTAPAREFTVTSQRDFHQIGFRDAPILELMEAPSPDDAIELERLTGRLIGPSSVAFDGAVADWMPAHARDDVAAIVRHLPPGEYWIVRSQKGLGEPGRALMGNEWLDVDMSIRQLHDSGRYYVLVVGATLGANPSLGRPLLGVTVLNYNGQETRQGLWLLAPLAPREESAEVESDVALFIIPVSGPLVLDHLEKFSAEDSARCRKHWAEKGAGDLALELATGAAHRGRR